MPPPERKLMNDPMPPNDASIPAPASITEANLSSHQLLPLWIWLGVAVAISFVGTPADPYSMMMALVYGLISFWVGIALGAPLNTIARVTIAITWGIPALALAFVGAPSHLIAVNIGYLVLSIIFGFCVWRRIEHGRLRILLWFSAGYLLGMPIIGVGPVLGAVVGVVLANTSWRGAKDG